jgi:hypothetical protein
MAQSRGEDAVAMKAKKANLQALREAAFAMLEAGSLDVFWHENGPVCLSIFYRGNVSINLRCTVETDGTLYCAGDEVSDPSMLVLAIVNVLHDKGWSS